MSCNDCNKKDTNLPENCRETGLCAGSTSSRLTVFNWLSDIKIPESQSAFDVVEVRFKSSRKSFFRNVNNLDLKVGDVVAVEASPGHDIGEVLLVGELVKLSMRNEGVKENDLTLLKVYRKATTHDIEVRDISRKREWETMMVSRKIASKFGLEMKISDIEYQGDNSKAIFYYTAEARVDFRTLIRELATTFCIRVEMRQIGLRQEAARVGGIGSCGRELCCSSWLTDFKSVMSSSARYQQLSLNPQKLTGQCGKLKCCLNFELDTYLDALKKFPAPDVLLITERGKAFFQKMDIFKGIVWYSYKDNPIEWIPIPISEVNKIIAMNSNNEKASSLEDVKVEKVEDKQIEFQEVVGQDDLNRFDVKRTRKKRPQRKRRNNNRDTSLGGKTKNRNRKDGK